MEDLCGCPGRLEERLGAGTPLSPLHLQDQVPGGAASGVGGKNDPVMLLLQDIRSCLAALLEKAGSSK